MGDVNMDELEQDIEEEMTGSNHPEGGTEGTED